jgi:hypothetical protein
LDNYYASTSIYQCKHSANLCSRVI